MTHPIRSIANYNDREPYCPGCGGDGRVDGRQRAEGLWERVTCERCRGTGKRHYPMNGDALLTVAFARKAARKNPIYRLYYESARALAMRPVRLPKPTPRMRAVHEAERLDMVALANAMFGARAA